MDKEIKEISLHSHFKSSIDNSGDIPSTSAGVEEKSNGPAQDPHLIMDLNNDASFDCDASVGNIEKPTKPLSPSGPNEIRNQQQTTKSTEKTNDVSQLTNKPCYCLDKLTSNNMRCITINGIKGIFTYDNLHHHMKSYGPVIRLRIRYDFKKNQSDVVVIFECECGATKACQNLYTSEFNESWPFQSLKQWDVRNVVEDPKDYKIKKDPNQNETPEQRLTPAIYYYITLKDGRCNLLKLHSQVQNQIGHIPDNNLRRYSRGILLKADTQTQAAMIQKIDVNKLPEVVKIEEHKTFNTVKGVLYSADLMDFTEDEIVTMCPNTVKEIYKVGGKKSTIIVTFNSTNLPDRLKIGPISIRLHNYIERPRQCQNCFSYLHSKKHCPNATRCYKCSQEMHNQHHPHNPQDCQNDLFCLHCKDNHSPNFKKCPTYQFEENILSKARIEFISPGLARRILLKSNGPLNSYSGAVRMQPMIQDQNKTQDENLLNDDNESRTLPTPKAQNTTAETRSKNNNLTSTEGGQSRNNYTTSKPKQPETNTLLPTRESQIRQTTKQTNKQSPKELPAGEKNISQSESKTIPKDIEEGETVPTNNKFLPLDTLEDEEEKEESNRNQPNYCHQCNQEYSTLKCLDSHRRFFHTSTNLEPSPIMRHEVKFKDHRCFDNKGNINCCRLLQYRNIDTGKVHLVDEQSKPYTSIVLFRRGLPSRDHLSSKEEEEIYGTKRILCSECGNLEFKSESCLKTHILTWHVDQPFEKNHRPRDHKCKWKSPCIELIEELKKDGSTKYCDSLGQQYKNVEEFRKDSDPSTLPTKFQYSKNSKSKSKPELKKDKLPSVEGERKRKQSSNCENTIIPTNKKPAQAKDTQIVSDKPTEMETDTELMSQSLPEQFLLSKATTLPKGIKDEQKTSSFVNQQTMKFERIGELNNPPSLIKPDGGKNPSMERKRDQSEGK